MYFSHGDRSRDRHEPGDHYDNRGGRGGRGGHRGSQYRGSSHQHYQNNPPVHVTVNYGEHGQHQHHSFQDEDNYHSAFRNAQNHMIAFMGAMNTLYSMAPNAFDVQRGHNAGFGNRGRYQNQGHRSGFRSPPPLLTLHAPIDLLRELFNLVEVVLAPIGEGTLTVIQIPIEARDPPLQLELRPPPLLPPLLGTRLLTAKETARVSLPLKEGNITRGTER